MNKLFSISIMGVLERYSFIKEMLKKLPAHTNLILDRAHLGCWQTAKQAWNSYTDAPYHMVLQDDILICDEFEQIVTNIINAAPNRFISLYSLRNVKPKKNDHWATRNETTAQGLIMPVPMIKEWMAWVNEYCLEKPHSISDTDDLRMDLWMEFTGNRCWFVFPHIIQHIGTKSALYGTTHVLPSPYYTNDTKKLLETDWTKGLSNPSFGRTHYSVEFKLLKPEYLLMKSSMKGH